MCIMGIKLGSLVDPFVRFTNKPSLQQQKKVFFPRYVSNDLFPSISPDLLVYINFQLH